MTALVRLYKKALQQIARVLAGMDGAERDAKHVLLEIKGHKEVSRATWKKLVLDLKVRSRDLWPHKMLAPSLSCGQCGVWGGHLAGRTQCC